MILKSILNRSFAAFVDVTTRFRLLSDLTIQGLLRQEHAREQLASRLSCPEPHAQEVLDRLRRQVQRLPDIQRELAQLADFLDLDTDIKQRWREALETASDFSEAMDVISDIACPQQELFLKGARLRVPQKRDVRTLIQEILVNQEYYFTTDAEVPRILDCGSHFGLAIYYFKRLYPRARITAFEPMPMNRDLLLDNVRRNNWTDVEVLPYALSDSDESASFLACKERSMGGSLTQRKAHLSGRFEQIEVPCRRLSEFLDEPIHFLKLDIEGVEDRVLAEAESKLANVQHLFCEYHDGRGLQRGRLAKILTILDRAGFDTHVSKSWAAARRSLAKPIDYVAEPLSMCIWGKARHWPG